MTSIDSGHRGEVSIRDLSKSFAINGRPLAVLKGLNLDIRAGECLVIVGASGSGKTTLLRVLAGLEVADGGRVAIDGEPVHGVGSDRAVIFQEPRLLPWLTVATSPSASRCVAKTAPAPRSGRATISGSSASATSPMPIPNNSRAAWPSASASPAR